MSNIIKIITVTFFAAFAFKIATPFALASNLSFIETFIGLALGGTIGVGVSFFGGESIIERWFTKPITATSKKKKVFTKTNRFIVRVLKSHGLLGLAIITPPLLSVPVGSIIAARFNVKYFKNTRYVLSYLLGGVVAWALVLSSLTYTMPYIKSLF
jgi:hypothetical protein